MVKTSYYTPSDRRGARYDQRPKIVLRGKWLERAGFKTGTQFTARVQDGKIILEKKQ